MSTRQSAYRGTDRKSGYGVKRGRSKSRVHRVHRRNPTGSALVYRKFRQRMLKLLVFITVALTLVLVLPQIKAIFF